MQKKSDKEKLDVYAVKGYVPIRKTTDGNSIEFSYRKLSDGSSFFTDDKFDDPISESAKKIHITDTCRTTAVSMVEKILGFNTSISRCHFMSLNYQTSLVAGQPDKSSFYVLPPPPIAAFKDQSNIKHLQLLKKLYNRLEEIPKLKPNSLETREKFDALKNIYLDMVGQNNLNIEELLIKILDHQNTNATALFKKRGFFSEALPSTTKTMFDEIKTNLNK